MKKLLYLLLALGLFAQCRSETVTEKPAKSNIILIVADDLGYADLGCYGSTFYDTPVLDALAKDGIQFTDGYATCPVCSPSRVSLQTGKYPVKTGVTDWIPGRATYRNATPTDRWTSGLSETELELEETTIAEVLQQNGYKTYFAGKWHLGETEEYWPKNQGYDINIGGFRRGAPTLSPQDSCFGYFSPYCNPRLENGPEGEYLADRLAAETTEFIEANQDSVFFVCLSFYLVHNPLQAKEEPINRYEEKRSEMGLDTVQEFTTDKDWIPYATAGGNYRERVVQSQPVYASMVNSLDENIGKVIEQLKALGLYENSLIIFTSDNGGLSTSEGSPTDNSPLRAGKGWLYEGGIRVPFLVKLPNNERAGSTNPVPVAGIDIPPTIAAFANGGMSEIQGVDGINMQPLWQPEEAPERPLFWHYPHYSNQGGNPGSVIRLGHYKLIHDFETGAKELYDLSKDISETNDLSEELPELRDSLYTMLDEWRIASGATMMTKPNPDWNGADPVVSN